MPDANGFPVAADVASKLSILPAALTVNSDELTAIIAGVIAHFQSPRGADGTGGTGRTFASVDETRYFDGNGYGEIYVGDTVPGTSFSVTDQGVPIPGCIFKEPRKGMGRNILMLPNNVSSMGYAFTYAAVFSLGNQNIGVTATWGIAATAPVDIYEAVRCEAAAQYADIAFSGMTGEIASVAVLETKTAFVPGSSVSERWHKIYSAAVDRYRESQAWKLSALTPRMS